MYDVSLPSMFRVLGFSPYRRTYLLIGIPPSVKGGFQVSVTESQVEVPLKSRTTEGFSEIKPKTNIKLATN